MAFTVSPGVSFREIDLTNVIQVASSIEGAFAGKFRWGPVLERVLVSNEDDMVARFGQPDNNSAVDFMTAASFLAYADKLRIVRIGNQTEMANATDDGAGIAILNDDDYDASAGSMAASAYIAKYPGALGNSIAVSTCTTADEFEFTLPGTWALSRGSATATYTPNAAEVLTDYFNEGDFLVVDGVRYLVKTVNAADLVLARLYAGATTPTTVTRQWAFANQFSAAPGTNEFHVVIQDIDGDFTAEPGAILEIYERVSTVAGTTYTDGTPAYYVDAINRKSQFVRVGEADPTTLNAASKVEQIQLAGGVDGNDLFGDDEYMFGYDKFANPEEVNVPLMIAGAATSLVANYLIQNIAEDRLDTIVFVSPEMDDVVNNVGNEVADIIEFRNTLPSTSYAFMDSGWKYMYDKYNDVYRWVPMNGDTAGCAARTQRDREAWYSIAGFNRGGIKNVTRLAFSPNQAQRDDLFVNGVNAITDFPGQGPTLFGDKTLLAENSAFNEIGVRRLFIILEKAIANASKFSLFEFNDPFTRAQFVSIVEPFMRGIKGRRGMQDFKVIADDTVNTPQVVDNNQFIGQIYVKPNRSIRYIELSFVAVASGVTFSEVVGQF